MAVPSGTIIVADPESFGGAGGLIAVHPVTGEQQTITQGGLLVEPVGLTVAADGTIFVADQEAFGGGGIVAVNPNSGQQTKISASAVFTRPMGLTMANDGRLVVSYLNQGDGVGKIMLVNPVNAEHHAVAPSTQWITPADVAINPSGSIVVADADIQGFQSKLRTVLPNGLVQDIVDEPIGLGVIYVGLAPKGVDMVVVSNGNGSNNQHVFQFMMGTPESFRVSSNGLLKSTFGVVVEPSGLVVVADRVSGIIRLDSDADTQAVVSAGGSLESPIAVALAR